MSETLRTIDARIRMAQRGTERIRGVVVSAPVSGIVSVRVAGTVLPAICPVIARVGTIAVSGSTGTVVSAIRVGAVVELSRPRGVGGMLHVERVLA